MKRYIYTSLGVLVVIGLLALYALTTAKEVSVDTNLPYGATASPTATSTATSTAEPTDTPTSSTGTPTEPTATPIPTPDPVPTTNPPGTTETGEQIGNASEVRRNPDGTIYFVDSVTGEKQNPSGATEKPGTSPQTSPSQQAGAGSDADKKNAAMAYITHANALYDGDWALACRYMQIPAGMDAGTCEAKLAQRTANSPIKSKTYLGDIKGNNVVGDIVTISPYSTKDENDKYAGGSTTMHRTTDPLVWLVDGAQLTAI